VRSDERSNSTAVSAKAKQLSSVGSTPIIRNAAVDRAAPPLPGTDAVMSQGGSRKRRQWFSAVSICICLLDI